MLDYSILVSALAGLGSFFSPCILPILPAFISYLAGNTINEVQTTVNERPTSSVTASTSSLSPLSTKKSFASTDDVSLNQNDDKNHVYSSNGSSRSIRKLQEHRQQQSSVAIKKSTKLNIFLNTVYFVLGFSLVFAVLGVVLNSVLVSFGTDFQGILTSIGGIVIIVFGAYLILSTKIRSLNFEKRMTHLPKFKTGYITSFVFGAASTGWTPCVGPILGSIFTLAATSPGAPYNSLLAFSIGLGIPFLITGAFFSQATGLIRRMVKHLKYFNPAMGVLLIILGILVFTNQLSLLGNFPLANEIINVERGF